MEEDNHSFEMLVDNMATIKARTGMGTGMVDKGVAYHLGDTGLPTPCTNTKALPSNGSHPHLSLENRLLGAQVEGMPPPSNQACVCHFQYGPWVEWGWGEASGLSQR